jgi:hypothetical protein
VELRGVPRLVVTDKRSELTSYPVVLAAESQNTFGAMPVSAQGRCGE